jgi:hypothetical protein
MQPALRFDSAQRQFGMGVPLGGSQAKSTKAKQSIIIAANRPFKDLRIVGI